MKYCILSDTKYILNTFIEKANKSFGFPISILKKIRFWLS